MDFFLARNLYDASLKASRVEIDVVSDATYTLTCPTGSMYHVTEASVQDDTRATAASASYTHAGVVYIYTTGANLSLQGTTIPLVGGGRPGNIVAGSRLPATPKEFWMTAGDTLELSIDSFVAADVVRKQVVYETYTV